MLNVLYETTRKVKHEVRPLMLPQLVRLVGLLQPGLNTLIWTNRKWSKYCDDTLQAIQDFEILIMR